MMMSHYQQQNTAPSTPMYHAEWLHMFTCLLELFLRYVWFAGLLFFIFENHFDTRTDLERIKESSAK